MGFRDGRGALRGAAPIAERGAGNLRFRRGETRFPTKSLEPVFKKGFVGFQCDFTWNSSACHSGSRVQERIHLFANEKPGILQYRARGNTSPAYLGYD